MELNQEKLKSLLKIYRLSEISRQSGISYNTLVRLSSQSKKVNEIEVKTAYKLAKALGITTDELINKIYDIEE